MGQKFSSASHELWTFQCFASCRAGCRLSGWGGVGSCRSARPDSDLVCKVRLREEETGDGQGLAGTETSRCCQEKRKKPADERGVTGFVWLRRRLPCLHDSIAFF